jgi:hypothetical protein
MVSKLLIGSMLLGGVLLGIIVQFVEPSVSDSDSYAAVVPQLLANSTHHMIAGFGFIVAILSIFIGTSYLAKSMQGEQKPGSDLAGLASILALLGAAVVAISIGLEMGIIDGQYADKGGDVALGYGIADAMFMITFMFLGATLLLLGIAILRQKNLHQIVGGITGLSGLLLLAGMLMPSADPGLASTSTTEAIGGWTWFLGFLGWLIMTMVIGGITIKQSR